MYVIYNSILTHGHLNMCIAIGKELLERGHRVSFTVNQEWKGKLAAQGFEELLLEDVSSRENQKKDQDDKTNSDFLKELVPDFWKKSWQNPDFYERHKGEAFALEGFIDFMEQQDEMIAQLMLREKPDFIFEDRLFKYPYLERIGIPWGRILSCNPLFRDPLGLPPGYCGLSIHTTEEDWEEARRKRQISLGSVLDKINRWYDRLGLTKVERLFSNWHSPYINFYGYPAPVDYFNDQLKMEGEWIQLDGCIRKPEPPYKLPEWFEQLPGKLLYLSMGTIACADIDLIQKLLNILAKSGHKTIVSKGPHGDRLQLHFNQWGENFLPQKQILPLIDLIVGHGGNNTFTESLYYGKPMLLSPFFGDQPDNVMRVVDLELGDRFDAYSVSESELLDKVQRLLHSDKVLQNVQRVSKQMQSRDSIKDAVDQFEEYVQRLTQQAHKSNGMANGHTEEE